MGARCIWGAEERFKSDVFDCVIQAVLVMRPLEPDFSSPTCYTVLSAVHAVNGQEFRGRLLSLLWRCLVEEEWKPLVYRGEDFGDTHEISNLGNRF